MNKSDIPNHILINKGKQKQNASPASSVLIDVVLCFLM